MMRSKINIDNYEAYLLDHMEGNLSREEILELQAFAAQHPHLNIDLNDLELVELVTDDVQFENKEGLKKVGISDEQFVAYIENELEPQKKQEIETLCASDEKLAKDLKLFQHTIIKADLSVEFEGKNQLKKQETKVLWLFSREVLAAAASLILIMGLWFMFRNFIPGKETFNATKINGIGKIKPITLHKTETASTFSAAGSKQELASAANTNSVALSTKTEKLNESKEDPSLFANNAPVEKVNNRDPKEEIKNNTPKKEENVEKEPVKYASSDPAKKNSADTKAQTLSQPYVIIEKAYDEDERQLASNEKNGFWKKAMKTLSGLNKLGVKKVNGTETTQSNNEQYLLSMGNLSIEKNRYNAE